uniref:BRO1 domain-containing protein n=1 Tax=Angiostrongylus cantonensis TaxID=6313 RepID=A0A158P9C8_ANGCA
MAKVGLEMKLLTSEVDAEAEKWDEYAENDIAMSSMAYNMYLFTRGDGPLKTTHDLFTQAEFFAEQANKMYKTVREFSYEASFICVPASAEKSELSTILERIPVHCQQLQVLVKSPTVGKSATFGKVDSVIQETKNLMNEIAKLVTSSFVCATKYEIEFRGGSIPRAVGDTGAEPRTSRESTVWRRTPSIRRTAPPPLITNTRCTLLTILSQFSCLFLFIYLLLIVTYLSFSYFLFNAKRSKITFIECLITWWYYVVR